MQKRVKETFSQSIFALMTSQVIVKILGLFYKLYLTNREGFGDEGNAIANAGFQIFALMLSITAIGIPSSISKLVSERTSVGDHKNAFIIFKISLIIFSILGMMGTYFLYINAEYLANNYLKMQEAELSIIALCPSILLVSVISVFKGFFAGRESIKLTARAQTMDQLVKTISTILMIELSVIITKKTNTVIMATYSNLATTIGNIVELCFLYKQYRMILPEIKREIISSVNNDRIRIRIIIKDILYVAIPIALTALITTVSKNIDSTSIVNDLKDVIGYEEAKRQYGILSGKVDVLINLPLSFNMAIVTTLLPSIASKINEIDFVEKRYNQSIIMGMFISMPIVCIYCGFSSEILKFLFPNASNGGEILKFSSMSIVFITIEQINNVVLQGIGKNTEPVKSILIGVIVKALFNRMLVPKVYLPIGGTIGAAIATIACHFCVSIISFIQLKKYTNIRLKATSIISPFMASFIMVSISKFCYVSMQSKINTKINLITSLGIGCIIYCIYAKNRIKNIKK